VLTVTTSYGRKAGTIAPKVTHVAFAEQLLEQLVREEKGRKGSRL
jgi:hypothetical protein